MTTRHTTRALAGVLVAGAAVLWLVPLGSSLWLDETGTFWIVKDGVSDAWRRALDVQGQSPLYYVLVWAVRSVAGSSEIVLRLPSTVAAAVATYFVFRIGRRLVDDDAGLLAAITFATLSGVSFAAGDARPYGIALALSTAATYAYVRWLDARTPKRFVVYAVLAALTVYAHYLFGITLLAHVALALHRAIRDKNPPVRDTLAALGVAAALCAPLVPQFLALYRRGGALSWTGPPEWSTLLLVLVQPVALVFAGLVVRRLARGRDDVPPLEPEAFTLLLAWSAAAPVITFAISSLAGLGFFHEKYYLSSIPAVALLVGWAVRGIAMPMLRIAAGVALVVAPLLSMTRTHFYEDWRAVAAVVNRAGDVPVLASTGFIESREIEALRDPRRRAFILAPFARYEVRGPVYALPFDLEAPARRQYVEELVSTALAGETRFVLVTNYIHAFVPFVDERLGGLDVRTIARYDSVKVTLFERR